MKALITLFFCLFSIVCSAQIYVEGGNTRHRFAQINLGLETKFYLNSGTQMFYNNENNLWQSKPLGNQLQQNIVIGGTHFWGHADFYVSIPLFNVGESGYRRSVETGAKYYPWRITHHKLRPSIGVAWSPSSYKSETGAALYKHEFPLLFGMCFTHKNWLFELNGQYSFQNKNNYYVSTSETRQVLTPQWNFTFGIKWTFDTTIGAEKDWESGKTQMLTDTLTKLKRLNSVTISVGPSSSFFVNHSNHNINQSPYLHEHAFSNVFTEFGVGYYWHQPDVHFNFAYRGMKSKQNGFGHSQIAVRRSISLEVIKFIGDYHGFVPFIGVSGSQEWLRLDDNVNQTNTTYKDQMIAGGVVFGWDIRPDRLQMFYLRTNLRWYPNLNLITTPSSSFSFDQLEFNFITLVLMVERLNGIGSKKKNKQ